MVRVNENVPAPNEQKSVLAKLVGEVQTYVTLIAIGGASLISFGVWKADNAQMTKRIEAIEALKPEQTKWMVDAVLLRINSIESEAKSSRDTIYEMKSKIDVIAEWVRSQKEQGHK